MSIKDGIEQNIKNTIVNGNYLVGKQIDAHISKSLALFSGKRPGLNTASYTTALEDYDKSFFRRLSGEAAHTSFDFNRTAHISEDPAYVGNWQMFFTTPELRLDSVNIQSSEYLSHLWYNGYKGLLHLFDLGNPFIPALTNHLVSAPDLGENSFTISKVGTTLDGYFVGLVEKAHGSRVDQTLSLEFHDDRNQTIHHIESIWRTYAEYLTDGRMVPLESNRKRCCVDYPSSAFYYALDSTGIYLQHWSRWVGVFPQSRSNDGYKKKNGEGPSLVSHNISFHASLRRDNHPADLIAFNRIATGSDVGDFTDYLENASAANDWNLVDYTMQTLRNKVASRVTSWKNSAVDWLLNDVPDPVNPYAKIPRLTFAEASRINSVQYASYRENKIAIVVLVSEETDYGQVYRPGLLYL